MKKIKDYFYRRKIRRLAERILANQPVMSNPLNRQNAVDDAIHTAEYFFYKCK